MQVCVPRYLQFLGKSAVVGVQRTTGKNMSHELKAIKEKTKACRGSSTVLLPDHWATLRVAKPLHVFANRCAQGAVSVL
jgi:hypothetical protein